MIINTINASAGGGSSPFANYSQWELPSELSNQTNIQWIRAANCSEYSIVQFMGGSTYYTYKTTDFKSWTQLTLPSAISNSNLSTIAISNNGTHVAVATSGSTIYVSRNSGSSWASVTLSGSIYSLYALAVSDDGYIIYSAGSSNNWRLYGVNPSNTTFNFNNSPYGGYLDSRIFKVGNRYCFSCKRGPSCDTPAIYVSSTTGSMSASTNLNYVDTSYIHLVGSTTSTVYGASNYNATSQFVSFTPSASGGTLTTLAGGGVSMTVSGHYDACDTFGFLSDGRCVAYLPHYGTTWFTVPHIIMYNKDKPANVYHAVGPVMQSGNGTIHVIQDKIYMFNTYGPLCVHMVDEDSGIYIPGILSE